MELSTDKFKCKYVIKTLYQKYFLKHLFNDVCQGGLNNNLTLISRPFSIELLVFTILFFSNYSENKDFEIDPKLNITQMSGGLRVHWQHTKDYNEKSLENKDQTEFINLKAHSSGKMQQVLFILHQQVFLFSLHSI